MAAFFPAHFQRSRRQRVIAWSQRRPKSCRPTSLKSLWSGSTTAEDSGRFVDDHKRRTSAQTRKRLKRFASKAAKYILLRRFSRRLKPHAKGSRPSSRRV